MASYLGQFSELVYRLKQRDPKAAEKLNELAELRKAREAKTESLGEALAAVNKPFGAVQEKEAKLVLQAYGLPQPRPLEQVIKTEVVEKNLDQLKTLGRNSNYAALLRQSLESTLLLGVNSFKEKFQRTAFALQEIKLKINERRGLERIGRTGQAEEREKLEALRDEVEDLKGFFEKELNLACQYAEEVLQAIEPAD